jgi:hypothetical protein
METKVKGLEYFGQIKITTTHPLDAMFMFFYTILFVILTPLFYNYNEPMALLSVVGAIWSAIRGVGSIIPSRSYYIAATITDGIENIDWPTLVKSYEYCGIMEMDEQKFVKLLAIEEE